LSEQIAPGPRGLSNYRTVFGMGGKDPLVFWQEAQEAYGNTIKLNVGPMDIWFFASAEPIYDILVTQHKNMRKGIGYYGLRKLLGEGLITTDGEHWSHHRSRLNPLFSRTATQDYSQAICDACAEGCNELKELACHPGPVDISHAMTRFTMRVISRAVFGVDLTLRHNDVVKAFEFAFAFLADITARPLRFPLAVPTQQNRKFNDATRTIDRFIDDLIDNAGTIKNTGSISSQLFAALDGIDRKLLRDEVLGLYFAGFETTARTMGFIMDLLPRHPDVLEAVRRETGELASRSLEPVDPGDLPVALEVVNEALRICPPVAMMARQNNAQCQIDGYQIKANSMIIVCPYLCQRNQRYWPAGAEFAPDFRKPLAERAVHRGAFTPFGAGPRLCLGKNFALLELVMVTSTIASRFDWQLTNSTPLKMAFHGSLQPAVPILADVTVI